MTDAIRPAGETNGFPIPDAALANHIAVLGKTGAGKTSTEKLIVEHVVAEGFRVCILDPIKSDWWGITSSRDGREPGLPFRILGGPRGHVSLPSTAGAAIGRLVGRGELPLSIIDMADFEAGGLQRFFNDFAPALMKSMRGVLYLVIEEAHEFAPKERAGIGNESMTLHLAKKMATAGRSKGLRLIVATQRTQSLHNALLGSCETVIAHRVTLPADQKPIVDWLRANSDKETADRIAGELSSLPTGSAWTCASEAQFFERIAFPKFGTFDNTATPMSDDEAPEVATAHVDQDDLRAIIGDAVAEAEANDPKALKAQIVDLKRQLSVTRPPQSSEQIERARQEGYRLGYEQGRAEGVATEHRRALGVVEVALIAMRGEGAQTPAGEREAPAAPPLPAIPPRAAAPKREPKEMANGAMPPGATEWMQTMRDIEPMTLPWASLAVLRGRKARGGHFNTLRRAMVDGGFVIESERGVSLTDAGRAATAELPYDRQSTLLRLQSALPSLSAAILKALAEIFPNGASAEALAAHLQKQPRGGHWNTGMSILRAGGVIEGRDTIRLATWVLAS